MQCREYDIFIRDAENMGITLDSRYVRFAVRSRAENNRVIDCLAKFYPLIEHLDVKIQ